MRRIATFFIGAALVVTAAQTAARAADFSDPKKTIETCAKAIKDADVDTIKSCFTSTDPDKQAMIGGMAQIMAASGHLEAAATDKFGADGKNIFTGMQRRPAGDQIRTAIENLKDSDEKIDGDTATLTAKPDPAAPADAPAPKPLYFKKVGGDWKIDFDKQGDGMPMGPGAGRGGPGGAPAGGAGAMFGQMTGVIAQAMNDTANDIKAGKYKTVDDAKQGLQDEIRAAFMAMMQQMQQQQGGGGGGNP